MSERDERDLVRWLHGDLEETQAERLRRAMEESPSLRRRRERWQRLWLSLADSPERPVPADLATRVLVRVRSGEPPLLSTVPGRVIATAALAAGLLLGVWVGGDGARETAVDLAEDWSFQAGLTEALWSDYAEPVVEAGEERR